MNLTPKDGDPYLEYILQAINAQIEPVYLAIEAEPGSALQDCVNIVARKVETSGGEAIFGWQIWRLPFLFEAEFHCVWQTPEGTLKDISPKPSSDTRILFVEDENLKYEGKQINSVRFNITTNKLVDDYIAITDTIFQFTNKGNLAHQHGLITLRGEEANRYNHLKELETITVRMLFRNLTRESLCGCNSQQKFQDCHGKNLQHALASFL